MRKIGEKIVGIILIMLVTLSITMNTSYANSQSDGTALGIDPADYDPTNSGFGSYGKFIGKANGVMTVIRVIGTIASVLSLALIGVRYMVGSIEERAEYKETMIPYIIGAIMLFAIPNLLGIIAKLVNSMKF